MNIQDIERLVALMDSANIGEFELQQGAETLHLRFSRQPAHIDLPRHDDSIVTGVSTTSANETPKSIVRAPAVGTFSHAHPLLDTPALQAGDRITEGQHIGYIGVESVLCAVLSPGSGKLGQQIAPDGGLVGYGDALVEIEIAGITKGGEAWRMN